MTVSKGQEDNNRRRRSSRMSLTYSDFPYYFNQTYGNDSAENMDLMMGALPREFQVIEESAVPLLQNAEDTSQDFIILAEFSEIEGPIPLCTIPTNAPDKTDINLNNFAVHLMSTDYQVNSVGQFKICEDTQVLRKNVFKDVHVFMQYFTLYDIKARGFVRPFCYGYVSKDHVKLDRKLDLLVVAFDKMTKVLKHANRKWFAGELEQYLAKLRKAKDSFIQDLTPRGVKEEGVFCFETQSVDSSNDPDVISLDQIAHQFSEIQDIYRTVKAVECPALDNELAKLSVFLSTQPEDTSILTTLQKLGMGYLPDSKQESIDSLNIPLVHPLKVKGESLRPLTTLGQVGCLHLVWKLLQVYKEHHQDLLFSEMTELTNDFRRNCGGQRQPPSTSTSATRGTFESSIISSAGSDQTLTPTPVTTRSGSTSTTEEESHPPVGTEEHDEAIKIITGQAASDFEKTSSLILDSEVYTVLDKVHTNTPIAPDNKSGSYHTVSEEESEVNVPSGPSTSKPDDSNETEKSSNSPTTPIAVETDVPPPGIVIFDTIESAIESNYPSPPTSLTNSSAKSTPESGSKEGAVSSLQVRDSRYRLSSYSSEEDASSKQSGSAASLLCSQCQDPTEEVIQKMPWWDYAASKLTRGQPGYGILNFFRHYPKLAHHVLYSILIGRPIIICGTEDQRGKVGRVITSLIPLVPSYPEKSWKLLRFHRGIIVQSHLKEYKVIGLCIPERLEVHDMISPRDQNYVTILNVPKKVILGPAYSGQFLSPFENLVQRNFYNSDSSLLSYIGGIYTEIETKIYMFKSLEDKRRGEGGSGGSNKRFNFKEIGLQASDADIVRYLGALIPSTDEVVALF